MLRRSLLVLVFALSTLLAFPAVAAEPQPDATVEKVDAAAKAPTDATTPAPVVAKTDAGPTEEADPEVKKDETKEQPVGPPAKPPENIKEAFETGSTMIEAAKSGYWGIFAGLLIMLLIYLLKEVVGLFKHLPSEAVPWVAAGLGIVGAIAVELSTGIHWGQALLHGFTAGATAVGLWEMLFKHLMKKKA